ncbi:MAG TPA: alkaline phosphatase family protein [bacterium]|nr:alkaline phosphatase family protein [bacterium]
MKRLTCRCLLILLMLILLAGCGANDDDDDNDSSPAADDDALDDDSSVDDDDDDSLDDDTGDDDTTDDDTIDDDIDDDDATPYWEGGEDYGPVSMDEYRLLEDQGLSPWEWSAGLAAKDALLSSASIHWVATLDVESGQYYLWHRDGEMIFERTIGDDGLAFNILSQVGDDPFPNQDPMTAAGYDDEIALLANPDSIQMTEHGYAVDDPRVGWIPDENVSYPFAYERITQIFDTPHGPDLIYGSFPSHNGGVGSHGNLGVMQSRATLLLSGAGVKPGLIDDAVHLVDIMPTVLALLGADPVEGIDRRGHRVSRNLQTWQDGRVLTEVLTDPSVQGLAERVVILLYDGLTPNELYHHYESDDGQDLPNFSELIENGAFYRGGALVGWPSFSFPGHTTIGTGAYQGHHGIVTNNNQLRGEDDILTVTWFLDRWREVLADPQAELENYLRILHDERGVETVFTATHRTFGDWDLLRPGTWHDAYAASVNEPTVYEADYSAFALMELIAPLWPEEVEYDDIIYDLADMSVPWQIKASLTDPTHEPPKVIYASFFTTDHLGEAHGPHSDAVREQLVLLDSYTGMILNAFKKHDLYDSTAFLVVSDHGMELQQPGAQDPWKPRLADAGIKYTSGNTGTIYLLVLRLETSTDVFPGGTATTFTVTVTDDDTLAPQAGVALTLTGGSCQPCTALTDDAGRADFTVTPTTGENMTLSAAHDEYCPAAIELTVTDAQGN